ncbi:hypothetical protein CMV_017997 [Castanea mollissima]|uniref:Alpha/beta hydrolase fold-3 domain-containing protein n=1 Tax=Castanea mollissima TaxID=60419 RepID=A0A8J4QRX0_9ROSI|nr:hypothetical protein CMV_017997 [Castanea mollissima]
MLTNLGKIIDPYDHFGIVRNLDGTVTRYLNFPKVEASPVASHGEPVVSKDLTLNPKNKTRVRIYMPTSKLCSSNDDDTRIPIIIYFAGSGWFLLIWDSNIVHSQCSALTQEVHAIVVNVDYRLAPENRLPVQYEDAMDAVLWVREQALDPNGEQWIREYGDISRCYLHGCSNGGNMAFVTALEATRKELEPLRIAGSIMNQPLFSGKERTNSEIQSCDDPVLPLCAQDMFWELALPEGEDRDIWYCNPMVEGPHTSAISKLCRCLVIGFTEDPTMDRLQEFVAMLVNHRVPIEAQFNYPGFHGIDMVDPTSANAIVEMAKTFINKP